MVVRGEGDFWDGDAFDVFSARRGTLARWPGTRLPHLGVASISGGRNSSAAAAGSSARRNFFGLKTNAHWPARHTIFSKLEAGLKNGQENITEGVSTFAARAAEEESEGGGSLSQAGRVIQVQKQETLQSAYKIKLGLAYQARPPAHKPDSAQAPHYSPLPTNRQNPPHRRRRLLLRARPPPALPIDLSLSLSLTPPVPTAAKHLRNGARRRRRVLREVPRGGARGRRGAARARDGGAVRRGRDGVGEVQGAEEAEVG